MKYVFFLLLALTTFIDPVKLNKINAVKAEARKAYEDGDYKTAIEKYRYLLDSLDVNEEEVTLNLANAYFLSKDTANAKALYPPLTVSSDKEISSKANQQMGVMLNEAGQAEQALNYFKQALKADPQNELARYNYEMLKKKLDERKKQQQQNQDQQNKDQKDQNKDQQKKEQDKKEQEQKEQEKKEEEKKDQQQKEQEKKNQEQKDQQQKDQQKKDEEKKQEEQKQKQPQEKQDADQKKDLNNLDKEKLQQMQISEEKARMILEAMKNQEKQYLQQQKRKATQPKETNKPDW